MGARDIDAEEVAAGQNLLNVRDIIARFELIEDTEDSTENADEVEERERLRALLGELRGNGGDEEWRGAWYPVTMVAEDYFEDYARELADDIGAVKSDAGWPAHCIDWEKAADELKQDYASVEYGGTTYWYH